MRFTGIGEAGKSLVERLLREDFGQEEKGRMQSALEVLLEGGSQWMPLVWEDEG